MSDTSRPAATKPSTRPRIPSQGEVWNFLSPRSPRKKPTSGETMSRVGIATSIAALRIAESLGRLSGGGAMRADLVSESFHKPSANRIVFNVWRRRRNPSRTPFRGQGEGPRKAIGTGLAARRAGRGGPGGRLAASVAGGYLAPRDRGHVQPGRGPRLPPAWQAIGDLAVTPIAQSFSGGRVAAGGGRDRGARVGAPGRVEGGPRGDRAHAAPLVGARAPGHVLRTRIGSGARRARVRGRGRMGRSRAPFPRARSLRVREPGRGTPPRAVGHAASRHHRAARRGGVALARRRRARGHRTDRGVHAAGPFQRPVPKRHAPGARPACHGPCPRPARSIVQEVPPMAASNSFDVTTGVDMMEVQNAVDQATKEIAQRYDFKGLKVGIELDTKAKTIALTAPDEHKATAVWDVLQSKMVKRKVPLKNLKPGKAESAAGSTVRQVVTIQDGLSAEQAKEVVRVLKDAKLKRVQASINAETVRISGPDKDDLQGAIALLKQQDFGVELKFGNYRSN